VITANQLVAHAVGDYVLQSDWMASEKTKRSVAALAHALTYALPFLFLSASPAALAVIAGTHFIIDRWRLARYVVWAKNFLSPPTRHVPIHLPSPEVLFDGKLEPREWWHPWSECSATGYHKDRPPWLTVWLLIIADNVMHVLCNAAALRWLA
jgi:hypothetical protein